MMKRLVVAAVAAVVLVLLVSGLAFADGGPHGGYTATTDACAGCHRAHTAAAAKLLIDTEADSLFYLPRQRSHWGGHQCGGRRL